MASTLVSRLVINLNELFDKDVKIELFSGLETQSLHSAGPAGAEEPGTIMFASTRTGNAPLL